LCNRDGCLIAIQVFDGNTADPRTLADQVAEVKQRFALARVVFVGDRGVVTSARIRADLQPVGLDWITALRAPSIQQLVEGGPLQYRCSMSVTSPRSPRRRIQASAASSAATRCSPPSAGAT
jgi:hypothetical protein